MNAPVARIACGCRVPNDFQRAEDPKVTVAALSLHVALGAEAAICVHTLDWESI